MAFFQLPNRADIPKYEFRADLDSVTYTFSFRFNSRSGLWIMDLKDEDNLPLIIGIPVLIGTDFLARFEIDGLPPGNLYAINLEDDFADAGRDDLGNNVAIIYNEA